MLIPGLVLAARAPDSLLARASYRDASGLQAPAPSPDSCRSAVLNGILISGASRTRSEVIERELSCRLGDPAHRLDCSAIEDRLRNLQLFSEIDVRTDSLADPCSVDLLIEVSERPSILPVPIIANNSKSGVTGGFGIEYRNFRGLNERLEVTGQLGGIQGFTLSYSDPWVAGDHLSLSVGASYRQVDNRFDDFTEETLGLGFSLGSYLSEHWRGNVGAGFLRLQADEEEKTISPNNRDRIHTLSAAIAYDSRDLYRNPRRGHLHSFGVVWNGDALGGTVDYMQYVLDVRRFQPVPWGRTLGLAARWIKQTGRVPGYRQVRLGGSSSIRGYGSGAFEGDDAIIGSIEWRFDIFPPTSTNFWFIKNVDIGLSAALFTDFGAAWGQSYDRIHDPLTWSDFAASYGAGIRLLLPWVSVARGDIAFTDSGRVRVVSGERMKF
jgi:outer membrane protein insertion porin family